MYAVIKMWGIAPILLSVKGTLDEAKEILCVHPKGIITDSVSIVIEPVVHYRLTWQGKAYLYRGAGMPFEIVKSPSAQTFNCLDFSAEAKSG